MQNNQPRNKPRRNGSPSNADLNNARIKTITKSAIKKFGPFLLTGLAAIAEHHWLKKDDSSSSSERDEHPKHHHSKSAHSDTERSTHPKINRGDDEEAEVRDLRDELAKLRGELKRNDKPSNLGYGTRGKPVDSPRAPSLIRNPRSLHSEHVSFQQAREEEYVRMPFAPTPPISYPAPFSEPRAFARPPQFYDPPSSSMVNSDHDRGIERSASRIKRRSQQRRVHVPRKRIRRRRDREDSAWHAGKVAAVAGLVEGLHVDDGKGDWVGMKGVRVGTTAAATFGATYLRERDPVDYRMRNVVADVGTGVLVSDLVYGKAKGKGRDGSFV